MAITIVASVAGFAINGGDVTLALAGAAANDIVVTFGGHSNRAGQVPGVVSPSGYTSIFGNLAANPNYKMEWKRMGEVPDVSVLLNGTANAADAATYGAYVLRGVTTDENPFNVPARSSVANGVPQSPSIITVSASVMVLATASAANTDTSKGTVTNFSANISANGNDTGTDHGTGGAASVRGAAGSLSPTAWSTWSAAAYVGVTVALTPEPIRADRFQSFVGAVYHPR
jgi:hypothetical protein